MMQRFGDTNYFCYFCVGLNEGCPATRFASACRARLAPQTAEWEAPLTEFSFNR